MRTRVTGEAFKRPRYLRRRPWYIACARCGRRWDATLSHVYERGGPRKIRACCIAAIDRMGRDLGLHPYPRQLRIHAQRLRGYLAGIHRQMEQFVNLSPTLRRGIGRRRLNADLTFSPDRWSHGVCENRRRIELHAGHDIPDACATALHELAHAAAPKWAAHGPAWRETLRSAVYEITGTRIRVAPKNEMARRRAVGRALAGWFIRKHRA